MGRYVDGYLDRVQSSPRPEAEAQRNLTDGIVAIDGSTFKAVNNRDKNFTSRELHRCSHRCPPSVVVGKSPAS